MTSKPFTPSCTDLLILIRGPVLVALLLRVVWAVLVPVVPVSDSVLYREFALSIARGAGFAYADGTLTAYWPVGTSAIYASLYAVFGSASDWPIVGMNIMLGLLVMVLAADLARHLLGGHAARVTAWSLALWPVLIQFTTILASELLFMALLMALLWLQYRHPPSLWRGLALGLLMAGSVYVRPTALPLLGVILLVDALRRPCWKAYALGALGLLLSFSLALAPWVERNIRVVGGPKLVSTNFGPNLWMGNNSNSNGGYMPLLERSFGNEFERDRYYAAEALAHIRDEPVLYMKRCIRRAFETFGRESIGVAWNAEGLTQRFGPAILLPLKMISAAYWMIMLLLGVMGLMIWAVTKRAWLHPMILSFGIFMAVPVLTVAQDRYHLPLNPLLAIGVAVSVAAWCARSSRPST